jgi:hypothetical protein
VQVEILLLKAVDEATMHATSANVSCITTFSILICDEANSKTQIMQKILPRDDDNTRAGADKMLGEKQGHLFAMETRPPSAISERINQVAAQSIRRRGTEALTPKWRGSACV